MGKLKSLVFAIGVTLTGIAALIVIPILVTLGSLVGGVILIYYLREDYLKAQALQSKPELHIVKNDQS